MTYSLKKFYDQVAENPVQGFKIKFHSGTIVFERKQADRIEKIFISYLGYSLHNFELSGVSAGILFPRLEKILKAAYARKNENYSANDTIWNPVDSVVDLKAEGFYTPIVDSKTFHERWSLVLKMIESSALPFFEKLNSLFAVADLLTSLKTPEEVSAYIQGTVLYPKTILVLKESNHPMFEKKKLEFYNLLVDSVTKNPKKRVHLDVFVELFLKDENA